MLNNQQPTLFESNRRGPLMVHRQPPSWLELAGLACARSGPCEASTCLANQPFCMRNLMGSSNFIPFSSIFYKISIDFQNQSTFNQHKYPWGHPFHPLSPYVSSFNTITIPTWQCSHFHCQKAVWRMSWFQTSKLQCEKGCLEPRLSIGKQNTRSKYQPCRRHSWSWWTLMGCTCLNLRSLHPTRLPNGNMARELSGRSTSCLGFGMAGNSAWRIYGWKWGNFQMKPVSTCFLLTCC